MHDAAGSLSDSFMTTSVQFCTLVHVHVVGHAGSTGSQISAPLILVPVVQRASSQSQASPSLSGHMKPMSADKLFHVYGNVCANSSFLLSNIFSVELYKANVHPATPSVIK